MNTQNGHDSCRVILLAEDRDDDSLLIRVAFRKTGLPHQIFQVGTGNEVVDYLEGVRSFSNRTHFPSPDLLLLDLKMPRMDGFRLLIELACRDQADFPVVVLTSSTARNDVVRSLFRGADKVISKPHSFEQLERELARAITLA